MTPVADFFKDENDYLYRKGFKKGFEKGIELSRWKLRAIKKLWRYQIYLMTKSPSLRNCR